MNEILKKIWCDILDWHNYSSTLVYPPTSPDKPVMEMTEHTECQRCGKVKRHVEWHWIINKNDFHSRNEGWLMDQ